MKKHSINLPKGENLDTRELDLEDTNNYMRDASPPMLLDDLTL